MAPFGDRHQQAADEGGLSPGKNNRGSRKGKERTDSEEGSRKNKNHTVGSQTGLRRYGKSFATK